MFIFSPHTTFPQGFSFLVPHLYPPGWFSLASAPAPELSRPAHRQVQGPLLHLPRRWSEGTASAVRSRVLLCLCHRLCPGCRPPGSTSWPYLKQGQPSHTGLKGRRSWEVAAGSSPTGPALCGRPSARTFRIPAEPSLRAGEEGKAGVSSR